MGLVFSQPLDGAGVGQPDQLGERELTPADAVQVPVGDQADPVGFDSFPDGDGCFVGKPVQIPISASEIACWGPRP